MQPIFKKITRASSHVFLRRIRLGTIVFLGLVFIAIPLSYSYSAEDSFRVRTFVGEDNTPPSVPTSLSATPITTTQIDLSWATSTDDFELSGYLVWRNDVQIATTTNTAYQDTGLTASTTYSYYITAFDSFFNVSASSSVATATTLRIPIAPAEVGGPQQGSKITAFPDQILTLQIFPQKDSVIIRYKTDDFIRSVIKWGRGSSYELGSLVEKAFSTQHETKIVGLMPGTKYVIAIEGENKLNRYGILQEVSFTTLPPDDVFPPGNVTNVSARRDAQDIVLSWTNPDDPDLAKIRVVRSSQFYPSDIVDGWVVYEGLGTNARDVLDADTPSGYQYYTIFTYDALGNISSGAVTRIFYGEEAIDEEDPGTETVIPDPTINPINLLLEHIEFSQEGERVLPEKGMILIDGSKQLSIAIPYDRVPQHLKTILMTIQDSRNHNNTFSFLLRVNSMKTGYVSTVAPFGTSGMYPFTISVFDFKTAQIGYTDGVLSSVITPIHTDDTIAQFSGFVGFMTYLRDSYVLWFILLLILLMFAARRLMYTRV